MKRPTILITNDDGFESEGLHELIRSLESIANLYVVVPSTDRSASSHSLTLRRPLRFIELKKNFYILEDGTPSDAVYLSLEAIFTPLGFYPDLVVSGINRGANLGEDITYSGTAAAALEAVLQGIPAFAISQLKNREKDSYDFRLAGKIANFLTKKILNREILLQERHFLNVNVPPILPSECEGVEWTRAGYRIYHHEAEMHIDPRGNRWWWLGLQPENWKYERREIPSDFEAVFSNRVSITPVKADPTAVEELKRLRDMIDLTEEFSLIKYLS